MVEAETGLHVDPKSAASRLEMRGISKRFPGTLALNKVSLKAGAGEVLALMGENGAGKSTLMKVLAGAQRPDEGNILVDGSPVEIPTVSAAKSLGIALIHQELMLAQNLDVAGNIFLGAEPSGGPLRMLDQAQMHRNASALLEEVGLSVDPAVKAGTLSTGQMQLVEICRALAQRARILIMDEPTSSLSMQDAERLLAIVKELRQRGISIIYISHRIEEVIRVADRITVLRDGANVGDLIASEADPHTIISMMVGRELSAWFPKRNMQPADPLLIVENLRVPGSPHKVSFVANQGEILGFAGLVGSGRTELMRVVAGVDRPLSGRMFFGGSEYRPKRPADAIRSGIYLVPEDRKQHGLILPLNVAENISLPDIGNYTPKWRLSRAKIQQVARAQVTELQIRPPDIQRKTLHLSGGNQQKVVLGKWLSMKPRLLILDEPTRGIDVGAKAEIYARMVRLADEGITILMVSSDMEEILGMSDRAIVLHAGRVAGVLSRDQLTRERIGTLMTGGELRAA